MYLYRKFDTFLSLMYLYRKLDTFLSLMYLYRYFLVTYVFAQEAWCFLFTYVCICWQLRWPRCPGDERRNLAQVISHWGYRPRTWVMSACECLSFVCVCERERERERERVACFVRHRMWVMSEFACLLWERERERYLCVFCACKRCPIGDISHAHLIAVLIMVCYLYPQFIRVRDALHAIEYIYIYTYIYIYNIPAARITLIFMMCLQNGREVWMSTSPRRSASSLPASLTSRLANHASVYVYLD